MRLDNGEVLFTWPLATLKELCEQLKLVEMVCIRRVDHA